MYKLSSFLILILLGRSVLAIGVAPPISLDDTHNLQQREQFKQLSSHISTKHLPKNKAKALTAKMEKLNDYVLYPYLELALIKRDLGKRPLKEITSFIERYRSLPFTPTFRRLAISKKFKAHKWQDVLALHKEGNSTKYQCLNLRAMYKTGQKKQALALVDNVWLQGSSLPKVCDPLLRAWRKVGLRTQILLMQRIELSFKQRNHKLARYLARSLTPERKKVFDFWYKTYRSPALLAKPRYWHKKGHFANTMLNIALERLIYQRVELAMSLLSKIQQHKAFHKTHRQKLINRLAIRVMTKEQVISDNEKLKYWLALINWQHLNKGNQSQILRYLVGQSNWAIIHSLYSSLWKDKQAPLEWQYWYASALNHLNQPEQAKQHFVALAKKRRYYGFLASDKLNLPYSLNHHELPKDQAQHHELMQNPYLLRAYELYRLDRNLEARREWYQLVKRLTQSQRISAAQIAHQLGWHDRAIITLTMTDHRDDLNLRFPTPYIDSFSQEAKLTAMDLSWPIAIARQESAFMARADSSVGAKGLMQLMPGTAKLQAKSSHVRYYRKSQLYKPSFNIKLGTGYLDAMLDKFDRNLAVAAAAYNAGPHRVKHWVKEQLPQDQWVETIPYRETREYVKNVLTYSVIYQQRLATQAKLPSAEISPHRMHINQQ